MRRWPQNPPALLLCFLSGVSLTRVADSVSQWWVHALEGSRSPRSTTRAPTPELANSRYLPCTISCTASGDLRGEVGRCHREHFHVRARGARCAQRGHRTPTSSTLPPSSCSFSPISSSLSSSRYYPSFGSVLPSIDSSTDTFYGSVLLLPSLSSSHSTSSVCRWYTTDPRRWRHHFFH